MTEEVEQDFRVLGCDPGKVNFGWAIYGDAGLEETGVIEGADSIDRLEIAAKFFDRLVRFTEPDICCVERFHQRPGKGSVKNMELVNLMIGQVLMICRVYRIPCKLITASSHKTWIAKNFKVEKSTKKKGSGVGKKYDIKTYEEWKNLSTEHEVDAANIAKYAHDYAMIDMRPTKKKESRDAK